MSEPRFVDDGNGASRSPWWGIHVARYRFALAQGVGGTVLDIASGSGYGSRLLAQAARVVGCDYDPEAAQMTARSVPAVRADGTSLPFPEKSFDAIVSFETIEHLFAPERFLDELRRVVKPGGRLLLSTPNALYTEPVDGVPSNPHHVREFTPCELLEMVCARFNRVRLLGQSLSPAVRMSPFHDDQMRLVPTLSSRAKVATWRALNKLPTRTRDRLSRMLWGHSLYLTEDDYDFSSEGVDDAPVLVVTASR